MPIPKKKNPTIPELIRQSKEQFLQQRKDTHQNSYNAVFSVVNSDGKMYNIWNGGCHYHLQSASGDREFVISSFSHIGNWTQVTEEEKRTWLDYLVNGRVYSPVFLEHDVDTILKEECVVATANVPSNYMASALVATRHMWEKSQKVKAFHKLIQLGANPDISFIIATGCTYTKDGSKWLMSVRPCGAESHHCFDSNAFTLNCVKGYIEGKIAHANRTYKVGSDYHGIDRTWITNSNTPKLFQYIGKKYAYGERPKPEQMLNVFHAVVNRSASIGSQKYDTMDLCCEKLSKDIIPQIEEEIKKL